MKKQFNPFISNPVAVAVGLLACGVTVDVFAHGYVSEPAGRSYLCKLGDNTGCGAVQWEPQSVEGPDGSPRFPVGGPEEARSPLPAHRRGRNSTRKPAPAGTSMTLPRAIKRLNGPLPRTTSPETGAISLRSRDGTPRSRLAESLLT